MELVTWLEQATFSLRVLILPFFIVLWCVEKCCSAMLFSILPFHIVWLPNAAFSNLGSQMVAILQQGLLAILILANVRRAVRFGKEKVVPSVPRIAWLMPPRNTVIIPKEEKQVRVRCCNSSPCGGYKRQKRWLCSVWTLPPLLTSGPWKYRQGLCLQSATFLILITFTIREWAISCKLLQIDVP